MENLNAQSGKFHLSGSILKQSAKNYDGHKQFLSFLDLRIVMCLYQLGQLP